MRATRDAITWSRRPSVLAPLPAQHHVHGPRRHLHRPETLPTTSGSVRPGPSLRCAAVGAGSTFSIPRVLTSRVPNTRAAAHREDPTMLRATPVSLSVPRNLRKAKYREPDLFTGSHIYDVTGSPAAPPPVGRVHASLGSREDFSCWT